jgi:hypothetical protein
MWMVANVAEADSPLFRPGQPVNVKVMAFPDREFSGSISVTGAAIDPATHTQMIRAEIRDPHHELRPGMLATYVITTGAPVTGLAIPADGVVREGDGSLNVWVTADGHHFTRRTVKVGIQRDSFVQIADGLHRTGGDARRRLSEQYGCCRCQFLIPHCLRPRFLPGLQAYLREIARDSVHPCLRTYAPGDHPSVPARLSGRRLLRRLAGECRGLSQPAPVILEITAQAPGLSAEEMEKYYPRRWRSRFIRRRAWPISAPPPSMD